MGVPTPEVKSNLDAVSAALKTDLDLLPPGTVVLDAVVDVSSRQGTFILDAGGDPAVASLLLTNITNNLRNLGRPFSTNFRRRADDGQRLNKVIEIKADLVIYRITNF